MESVLVPKGLLVEVLTTALLDNKTVESEFDWPDGQKEAFKVDRAKITRLLDIVSKEQK